MSRDSRVALSLNCGSSSLKFALFQPRGDDFEPLIEGEAEAIGTPQGRFSAHARGQGIVSELGPIQSHESALARLLHLLNERGEPAPAVIGHRIVHGGPRVRDHCLIDAEVGQALDAASRFTPLHAPAALSVLTAARRRFAELPHIACLDTAFHRYLPEVARRLPLAASFQDAGIERYGFHGLSCESVLRQLGADAPHRIIIAHLGSGSSVTAVKAGRSVDTSMGLTPTGGVMMATRTGDLDPELLVYLIREQGLDVDGLEALVNRDGGMAAVSAVSGDVRVLRKAIGNARARLAIEMYAYSIRKQIAAMTAALEGVDLLVFTGGVGQHDVQMRAEIRSGLGWLGLDGGEPQRKANGPSARVDVRVLAANEEEQIARHAIRLTD